MGALGAFRGIELVVADDPATFREGSRGLVPGRLSQTIGVPEFRAQFGPFARDLPLLFVWGKRESVPTSKDHVSWDPMNTKFRELRLHGGTAARVIDPCSEHGGDDSRLLVIPFFDAVLAARERGEPLPGGLRDMASLEARESDEATRIGRGARGVGGDVEERIDLSRCFRPIAVEREGSEK